MLPLINLISLPGHICFDKSECFRDIYEPLPRENDTYIRSYKGLEGRLKALHISYLEPYKTTMALNAGEIGNGAVKSAYGNSSSDSLFIIVEPKGGVASSLSAHERHIDVRIRRHINNMLLLDNFNARASYARYISAQVSEFQADEPSIVWRAYRAVGLDSRADRAAFLLTEKQAAIAFLDNFNVHPRTYSQCMWDSISVYHYRRFGGTPSREDLECFFDELNRPSRANVLDEMASNKDMWLRRYRRVKTGSARSLFLRFPNSREEIGTLEWLLRQVDDIPLSRGALFGFVITFILGLIGISVRLFGGPGPDDNEC